jgi:diaminopimelate epimerase
MSIAFTKMHGLGNDFLVIRGNDLTPFDQDTIRRLADRRTGVGFDQLLWLERPRQEGTDVYFRIFNSDGSEAEQCGNGARCIARLLADDDQRELVLEYHGGTSRARVENDGMVAVEIGIPEFRPELIPFEASSIQDSYTLNADDETFELQVLSVGNPHAVMQVDSIAAAPVERIGPLLESHSRFPNRANIGFMQVVAPDRIKLRVFERGVGETTACGTGACAAVVAGRRSAQLADRVNVELPGGTVTVNWDGPGEPVWLTGETATVFEGTINV